jgi:hypothetical protein
MKKPKDKAAAETHKAAKPPGYGKLTTLLKRVVTAPPLKNKKQDRQD